MSEVLTPGSISSTNDGLALAALIGNKNGYYENGLGITQMGGICDLRHDVAKVHSTVKGAECNLAHKIGDAECRLNTSILNSSSDIRREVAKEVGDTKFLLHDNISNLGQNINNRFGIVDVEITRTEGEVKLSREQVIKEVNAETRHQAERNQDRLDNIDQRFSDKLCAFERRVDAGFTTLSKELADCCCEMKLQNAENRARESETALLNLKLEALTVKKA